MVTKMDPAQMQAHLATIVDSSDDAIHSNELDGAIRTWNLGAEKLYGYTAEEIVGKPISMLVPPDRPGEVKEILLRSEKGERVDRLDTERLRKDGTVVPVSLTISPIRDKNGAVIGAATIARDIKYRKLLEVALEAARDQALETSRLKSEFLTTMSHEIRTPMNGVIGMTGMLLDTELDPDQREYAETVRFSGEALLTIINDILDFSKIEAGKLKLKILDFDLRTAVKEAADLLAAQANFKGLELNTIVRPEVPTTVRGDPGRLRQVLINLVGNAIKFTETGEVVVRVGLAAANPHEFIVRFEVTDTGVGIAPDFVPRLFDSFSQADSSNTRTHGGTGLGLALSKQLVELMGGSITVDSKPGQGSTFTFTVRLTKRPDKAPGIAAAPGGTDPAPLVKGHRLSEAEAQNMPRLLVAEDNPVNQKIAAAMLAKIGYRADIVANGAEAVEAFSRIPYGAILMDCQMPKMDGYQATVEIRKREQGTRIPIIAMTASNMAEDRDGCLAAGMDDFLSKPVAVDVLAKVLRLWIANETQPGDVSGAQERTLMPVTPLRAALDGG